MLISDENYIILSICGTSMCSWTPYNYSNYSESCKLYFNNSFVRNMYSICNGTFQIFQFDITSNHINIAITPPVSLIGLTGLKLLDKYYYSYPPVTVNYVYFPSNFFIAGEQTIIVYYSPTIRNVYDNKLAYGLFGGDKVGYVDFNINTDHISNLTPPNTTTLVLQSNLLSG
jgi:hypothetical protein